MPKKIEKMKDFFDKRADNYDDHMKSNIKDFNRFYSNIATEIKDTNRVINILDIGCGTGLELKYIFQKTPHAKIICLDLSEQMLNRLKEKYSFKNEQIELKVGSYLEDSFEENKYDYIVSAMTLHHLRYNKKLALYKKIYKALKSNGIYIEGDYIVDEAKEKKILNATAEKEDIKINGNYHIDLPFSINTQKQILAESGFSKFNLIYEQDEAAVYSVFK
ncbi:MAG: class I SAM-dependent methyltransferase [Halanaerobiales bacterium]